MSEALSHGVSPATVREWNEWVQLLGSRLIMVIDCIIVSYIAEVRDLRPLTSPPEADRDGAVSFVPKISSTYLKF